MFKRYWLPILFLIYSHAAFAEKKELIGQLSLSDILVQPKFETIEGGDSRFSLDRSYFFFSWEMNNELSAHFGVGKKGLLNRNYRLPGNNATAAEDEDFSFFEVYGQYNSGYGIFRAGIIPLNFGWEGSRRESEWYFPATLFVDSTSVNNGADMHDFGLRDYGVSYDISWRGFYTTITIHNGEGSKDQDGKLWHTGRWGWHNDGGVEFSISASSGKYQQGAIVDVYKYMYLNSFFTFQFEDLLVLIEGSYAEEEKSTDDSYKKKFWDVHFDLSHPISRRMNILARYELYEPDTMVVDNKTTRYIAGLAINNAQNTSSLYIWGIKNKEEANERHNDELQIVWKVRSLSIF